MGKSANHESKRLFMADQLRNANFVKLKRCNEVSCLPSYDFSHAGGVLDDTRLHAIDTIR